MIRILFFIGSLGSGGKERRLIELLTWLKKNTNYELFVILTFDRIHYPAFKELNIDYLTLNKSPKYKDPYIFFRLYKICKRFKPDIIHTWGSMQAFYILPSALLLKKPLVNSQITSAPPERKETYLQSIINLINFRFSSIILSNSEAGLISYGFNKYDKKCRVIYNGFNSNRIVNLLSKHESRKAFKILTHYAVVMVGKFSDNKDFFKFVDVCKSVVNKRHDITFIAAGEGKYFNTIKNRSESEKIKNLRFLGRITNVEELVNACDIGVLFTNKKVHGEGVSNSILEYMALGKPVIANDAGGTIEILVHNESGYLITNETNLEIADIIVDLLENQDKRLQFGEKGASIIHEKFSLDRMGREFEEMYADVLTRKQKKQIL